MVTLINVNILYLTMLCNDPEYTVEVNKHTLG